MYSPIGKTGSRCPVCGNRGGSQQYTNSSVAAAGQAYSTGSTIQLGADEPVISAQTDKIIQLRRELKLQSPDDQFYFVQNNSFPTGKNIETCISEEYPKVLNRPSDNKGFKFDRYVPYDHIHADLEVCSISPKHAIITKQAKNRSYPSSTNKVSSALTHIEAAKRILSSA